MLGRWEPPPMHPAKSVILFTTASGAGYGLIAWLGVLAAPGLLPAARWFGLVAFGLGLGLVVLGLLSSTLHRLEEHTSELQSLMRISYAVFCLKIKSVKHANRKASV